MLWRSRRPSRSSVLLCLVVVAVLVAALVLTATRSVLFGLPFVTVAAVLLVSGRRRGPALVVAGLVCAALIAVPALVADRLYDDDIRSDRLKVSQVGGDTSLSDRLDLLSHFELVLREPWGRGLGSSGQATRLGTNVPVPNVDNGYLALAQETGVVGLACFLLLLYHAVFPARRALGSLRGAEGLAWGGSVLGVLYFTVLMLTASVLSSSSALLFWIFLGFATRRAALARASTGSPPGFIRPDGGSAPFASLTARSLGTHRLERREVLVPRTRWTRLSRTRGL